MQVRAEWIAEFPEWADRWEEIAKQLMTEATGRGGAASHHQFGQVRLHAPADSDGTCLRVYLLEEGSAVIVGEGFRALVGWSLTNDHNHTIVKATVSIMDGFARMKGNGSYSIPFDSGSVGAGDTGQAPSDSWQIASWEPTSWNQLQ